MIPVTRPTCAICGNSISALRASQSLVCVSAMCEWKLHSTPVNRRCVECARPLTNDQLALRVCANARCRRVHLVERPMAAHRARRLAVLEQGRVLRDRTAHAHHIADAAAFRVTMIPRNHERVRALSARRRRQFEAHMRAVIEQAVTHEALVAAGTAAAHEPLPPLDTPPKPIADLLMQACIACRGFCCRTGGEHAYITPRTIADYRRAHPDAEANDIVATYTSYLPSHAMERACVFQHAQGCTLPREIRGDTCNRFYCGALTQLAYDVREEQTPKAFLIPTNDASFADALFAAPQFAQRVRRRAVRDDESPEPHEKG